MGLEGLRAERHQQARDGAKRHLAGPPARARDNRGLWHVARTPSELRHHYVTERVLIPNQLDNRQGDVVGEYVQLPHVVRGNAPVTGPTDLTARIIALLPRLRRFALTLTRHPDDGDDLVQLSVEPALSRLHRWNEGTRLDSWMFKIMQNLWIDELRSRRSRGQVDPDFDLDALTGSDGREAMDQRLALQDTLTALMALPEEQRAVMLLVAVEGFSYRDASEVLEVPIGTVMSRISRARAALDQQWQPTIVGGTGS